MVTRDEQFARLRVDCFFHERVWRKFAVDVFAGVMTAEQRQEAVASFIREYHLAGQIINPRHAGPRDTWREAFERGYRVKFQESP